MDQQFSEDVEGRVTSLRIEHKWILRLQQNREDSLEKLKFVGLVAVVSDCPKECQAQVFLVAIDQRRLKLVYYLNNRVNIVVDAIQKRIYDHLHRLKISDFPDDLEDTAPSLSQNMSIIVNYFVQSNDNLFLELWEFALDQI